MASVPPPDETPRPLREVLDALSQGAEQGTRLGRARTRVLTTAHRATTWGPLGGVAEIAWRVWGRDRAIAGGVLAAALAYRVFTWILPLALLLVAGLGLYSSSAGDSSEESLGEVGLTGVVAGSVAAAADDVGLLAQIAIAAVAGVVFLQQSLMLLRTLRAVSSFAWGLPVQRMSRPAASTLTFLALILAMVVVPSVLAIGSDLFGVLALLAVPASLLAIPVWHLVVSAFLLPNAAGDWRDLVPGALLCGVGVTLLEIIAGLLLAPWLSGQEETYGVLGAAAGLLLGFFILGRLLVAAACLSAVLARDRVRPVSGRATPPVADRPGPAR